MTEVQPPPYHKGKIILGYPEVVVMSTIFFLSPFLYCLKGFWK